MKKYCIAGSGTDVGKTFILCALIENLRKEGHSVAAIKPLLSGYDPENMRESDAGHIARALGLEVNAANVANISPLRFSAPQSPDIAAAREGKTLSPESVITASAFTSHADVGFVETIGGACVPINADFTVTEWIKALHMPVIFVSGMYLGGLSHTISAMRCLTAAGIEIERVIVNPGKRPPSDIIAEEFIASLSPHSPATPELWR